MRILLLTAVAIALPGCSTPLPVIQTGPDPADAAAPITGTTYTPVTAGTGDYRPVEPKSWRDLNDRVAPGARRTP